MPKIYLLLITSISIATCWLIGAQQAHGQLLQVLNDAKNELPFQYAPDDPLNRSKLFNKQTKHYGLGYNCDSEEYKRNSPHICWKSYSEKDLPSRTGWWQRFNRTVAEVKQRIADGSCIRCAEEDPCQRCQQGKCGGCCDCKCSSGVAISNDIATSSRLEIPPHEIDNSNNFTQAPVTPRPPYEDFDVVSTETLQPTVKRTSLPRRESLLSESKSNRRVEAPVRVAGLESLDIRVK